MKQGDGIRSGQELAEVRALIEQRSGILFDASRERFFTSRVRDFMEHKRLEREADLMRLLRGSNAEYDSLLQSLLTQETSFFRYPAVYEALEKRVLPELHMKKFWESPRSLRVWSAGCSTGEEPYSIAMTVADTLEFAEVWQIQLLATDISREALDQASRGVYSERDLEGVSPRQREQYFVPMGEQYAVKPRLRNMVNFAPMNLAQAVYVGRFDIIFCMNVLIYFSEERRSALIQRFFDYLEPGGYLFLGHAESVAKVPVRLETIIQGEAMYYRKPSEHAATVAAGSLQEHA